MKDAFANFELDLPFLIKETGNVAVDFKKYPRAYPTYEEKDQ